MIKWLLRQWHRFTLGSTAHAVIGPFATRGAPGSLLCVVAELEHALERAVPTGVYFEVCTRRAMDLNQPTTIRVVIETRGGE